MASLTNHFTRTFLFGSRAISSAFTRTLATQESGKHSGVGSSSGSSGAQGASNTYSQSSGDARQQDSSAENKNRNRTSEHSHERDQKTRAGKDNETLQSN